MKFIVKIKPNRKSINYIKWGQNGGYRRLTIERINKGLNVKSETIKKYAIKKEDIDFNKAHNYVKAYFIFHPQL